MLSCVLYYLIENYVLIDYILCQSKTLRRISSNRIFEQTSFKILIGIGIPDLLLNLLFCHGFTEKPNSTVILNCLSNFVNDYLAKGFFILEKSKQLIMLTDDIKLRIHAIEQLETYFFMKKTAFYSVANTIIFSHTV